MLRRIFSQKRCSSVKVGLFCWVHYCSKLCQSSSWKPRREASLCQNLPNSKPQAFPRRTNPVLNPIKEQLFPQFFQGPGPGEAPFHFSRFVCWVSLLQQAVARAAPGSPEGKQAFSKIAKFKLQAFPKRTNPLLKPLLKNSFFHNFPRPLGPGEAPFHFSRFVCWVHYCSKLCQSSPWKHRREASLFQRQLPNSNSQALSQKKPIPY